MGAFDGIKIPYDKGYPTTGYDNNYEYFSTQTAFSFFEGFGITELKQLLTDAESKGCDTVWVPEKRGRSSGIGLSTWYVKALIQEHFGIKE
jgi:hypothetical protein